MLENLLTGLKEKAIDILSWWQSQELLKLQAGGAVKSLLSHYPCTPTDSFMTNCDSVIEKCLEKSSHLPGSELRGTHFEKELDYSKSKCLVCGEDFKDTNHGMSVCKGCDSPYHSECWEFNKGCGIFGCHGKEAPKIGLEEKLYPKWHYFKSFLKLNPETDIAGTHLYDIYDPIRIYPDQKPGSKKYYDYIELELYEFPLDEKERNALSKIYRMILEVRDWQSFKDYKDPSLSTLFSNPLEREMHRINLEKKALYLAARDRTEEFFFTIKQTKSNYLHDLKRHITGEESLAEIDFKDMFIGYTCNNRISGFSDKPYGLPNCCREEDIKRCKPLMRIFVEPEDILKRAYAVKAMEEKVQAKYALPLLEQA
jgi:hypothetical protein